jgi:hypothetical protein
MAEKRGHETDEGDDDSDKKRMHLEQEPAPVELAAGVETPNLFDKLAGMEGDYEADGQSPAKQWSEYCCV